MTALKEGGITMKHAKKKATRKRAAKKTRPAKAAKSTSKKQQVIDLLSRPEGCTLPALMKAMGWLRHTTRAVVSTLGKTIKIESTKPEGGERTYIIKGAK